MWHGINSPICVQKYYNITAGANAGQLQLGDTDCQTVNSGSSPGLAFKLGTGWLVARAGKDVFNTLATERKLTYTTATGWVDPTVHAFATAAGVDAVFNPANSKFEVYFVNR